MASNKKKQASQEPQDEFIMDLVSTPEGIIVNTNEAVDFFKASDVMMKQAELVPNDNNNAGPSWRIVDDSAGGTVAQQKEAPTENPGPSREAVAGGKVAQQEQTSEGSDSEGYLQGRNVFSSLILVLTPFFISGFNLSHEERDPSTMAPSRSTYEPNAVCWPIRPTGCHFFW